MVNRNHPTFAPLSDPASRLSSQQRLSMIDSLVQGLCDNFSVNSTTGEVREKTQRCNNPNSVAAASKAVGCCCLCVLTSPGARDWTIHVSQVMGPQTIFGLNQVIMSPTNTPVEFGSFTPSGALAFQGQVPAFGHELCGHAALGEISAHPPPSDRTRTDVHDPTVRIENVISAEQGVPASQLRGLAASGPHRGESVDRITLRGFQFNNSNVSSLPTAEQSKLRFAANYIRANNSWVDILGHSDSVGSSTGKQRVSDDRAQKVKADLISRGVSSKITKFGLTNVDRFTRVEGLSDSVPPPPPLVAQQENWRRADILIEGYPAGAQRPPAGTLTTVTPAPQNPNVARLAQSSNSCISLLVRRAYNI